jgi:hypothetical protein
LTYSPWTIDSDGGEDSGKGNEQIEDWKIVEITTSKMVIHIEFKNATSIS